jgi:hypothetical protein
MLASANAIYAARLRMGSDQIRSLFDWDRLIRSRNTVTANIGVQNILSSIPGVIRPAGFWSVSKNPSGGYRNRS